MSTLYRKYRPQTFNEVAGQEHIKQILQNEIISDNIAHAFLFSGSRGIGKTTIARILAKAVNCENRKDGEGEPCNICAACREIIESKSLDVIEMDAATHTQVDKIRENIIENIRFAPSRRKYKIFIIDEVHMLSISAFSALLKTLEEPPKHAIFILATTEIHKIPETIISRCQRFDFNKISYKDLLSRVKMIASKEGAEIDEEVLRAIARSSDGGLRDAEGILGQILSISPVEGEGNKKITMNEACLVIPRSNLNLVKEFIAYLAKKDSSALLKFVTNLSDNGIDIRRFIDEIIEYLREILYLKFLGDSFINDDVDIKQLSHNFSPKEILKIIEVLLKRKQLAQYSRIDALPLELSIVEFCYEEKNYEKVINLENVNLKNKIFNENKIHPIPSDLKKDEKISSIPKQFLADSNSEKNIVRLDEIRENWYTILNKSQEYSRSLSVVLHTGVPLSIEGNVLKICFQYTLYKDRLNKEKNREFIEKILFDIFNKKIYIESVVVDAGIFEGAKNFLPQQKENPESELVLIEKIAESFGGKVIG